MRQTLKKKHVYHQELWKFSLYEHFKVQIIKILQAIHSKSFSLNNSIESLSEILLYIIFIIIL